jgi:hypothetical protein
MRMRIGQDDEAGGQAEDSEQEQGQTEEEVKQLLTCRFTGPPTNWPGSILASCRSILAQFPGLVGTSDGATTLRAQPSFWI